MRLILQNGSKKTVDPSLFNDLIAQAERLLPDLKDFKRVELWLTGDNEIQALNRQYRDKDKPTDVLSFPVRKSGSLGQLVISVETTERQAEELGQSFEEELKFLFTHGLLHLLGYDHETPEEEAMMLEKAYAILGRRPSKIE